MIAHTNFPLSTVLYYGIGGTARFLLEAESEEDILEALDFVRDNRIERLIVVGLGSNLLFPDDPFDGAVLRITSSGKPQLRDLQAGRVQAFAGEDLDHVISFGFDSGYTGLEWAGGLPGTVGAAVRGNVGAFGGELKDLLERAELLEIQPEGAEVRGFSNAELRFSYRDSAAKQNRRLVVLSATFQLRETGQEELLEARRRYRSNIEYRHRNHPMEHPTCGSVFKNVEKRDEVERILAVWPDVKEMVEGRWHGKVSMGYAVNRLGLAGYQIGGAQVSLKHNNFIVNLGGARFSDVFGIIEKVKEQFSETFGFAPEAEVEIVDWSKSIGQRV